jgi:hypothetical protein
MNKHAEDLIVSILEEHARAEKGDAALEAKSLFRLLNYCPPEIHLIEKPAPRN